MLIIRYTRIFAVNLQETAGTNKQAIIKKCSDLICNVSYYKARASFGVLQR